MLADIRAYDRCQAGRQHRRRAEYPYETHRAETHRCETSSELRSALERPYYYEKPIETARRLHDARHDPDGWPAHGRPARLCRGCFRRALQKGFTPDQWKRLNTQAAEGLKHSQRPKPLPRKYKPTTPHPREDRDQEKTLARIREAITKAGKTVSAVAGILGRPSLDELIITATDGSVALLEPGEGTGPRVAGAIGALTEEWIDLPPVFQLALRRVALLANDRTSAVRFHVAWEKGEIRLTLHASCVEYGEATEYLPIDSHNLPLTAEPFDCCLSAEYMDWFCGSWPLRWYLHRPQTSTRPNIYRPGETETITEEKPQTLQPAGCEWRLAIMPMRI